MKHLFFIFLLAITFTSCKKDRVCTCTNSDGTVVSERTYTHMTKKEARTYCTSTDPTINCTVK